MPPRFSRLFFLPLDCQSVHVWYIETKIKSVIERERCVHVGGLDLFVVISTASDIRPPSISFPFPSPGIRLGLPWLPQGSLPSSASSLTLLHGCSESRRKSILPLVEPPHLLSFPIIYLPSTITLFFICVCKRLSRSRLVLFTRASHSPRSVLVTRGHTPPRPLTPSAAEAALITYSL